MATESGDLVVPVVGPTACKNCDGPLDRGWSTDSDSAAYIARVADDGTDRTSCCDVPSQEGFEGEAFRRCSFCRLPLAASSGSRVVGS